MLICANNKEYKLCVLTNYAPSNIYVHLIFVANDVADMIKMPNNNNLLVMDFSKQLKTSVIEKNTSFEFPKCRREYH